MQRNQVPYDAFADDDDERSHKKTLVAALSEGEDSDEPNEEEEYLKQIRKERFLRDVLGEPSKNNAESDDSSAASDSEASEKDEPGGFSKEEKKEMEEFVQRVERERRSQRSLASRRSFRGCTSRCLACRHRVVRQSSAVFVLSVVVHAFRRKLDIPARHQSRAE